MTIKILESYSHDPYENLALEDLILRDEKIQDDVLILYRNEPCVVLGNFQCLWKEIPSDLLKKYSLKVVRRQSGGGTVYHDLGNLNFSFIFKKEKYLKNAFSKLFRDYFQSIGISIQTSGRDDFGVLDENSKIFYKFSGQAFKQTKDKVLHHGTLLFESDLEILQSICLPNKKIISKSVNSVVSKVINIKSLNLDLLKIEDFQNDLVNYLLYHKNSKIFSEFHIDRSALEVKKDELMKWGTIFGKTPKFEFPFDYKCRDSRKSGSIKFVVQKGRILSVEVASNDVFYDFFNKMVGLKLKEEDFKHYILQFPSIDRENFADLFKELQDQLFIG